MHEILMVVFFISFLEFLPWKGKTAVQIVLNWSGGVIRYRLGVEVIVEFSLKGMAVHNGEDERKYHPPLASRTASVLNQDRVYDINFPAKLIIGVGV